MSAALRKASKPVQVAIAAAFADTLPQRGGYRATATKSMRFRATVQATTRTGRVRIIAFAVGEKERRDLPRINKGELRHPVFGRSRTVRGRGRVPNPWATTKVPARFFDRGTAKAADDAETQLIEVLDGFAERLAKG